jgi:hypothetical protein
LEFRSGFSDIYPLLFGGGNEQDEYSTESQFSKEWGWFASLAELAKNDVTKIEKVTKLNMHLCLKFLSYKIDKDNLRAKQLEKINKKYGR